jgi:transposase
MLLFLPPYSPDFSPIEPAWSKLKTLLRGVGARTTEALHAALTTLVDAITHERCPRLLLPLRLRRTVKCKPL